MKNKDQLIKRIEEIENKAGLCSQEPTGEAADVEYMVRMFHIADKGGESTEPRRNITSALIWDKAYRIFDAQRKAADRAGNDA